MDTENSTDRWVWDWRNFRLEAHAAFPSDANHLELPLQASLAEFNLVLDINVPLSGD